MGYVVIYHNNVEADVISAKIWYKTQLLGLDKRLALAIKESIKQIQDYLYLLLFGATI